MFREGVEAALIVGIVAAYLRKTGRADRLAALWIGVGLSAGAREGLGSVVFLVATFQQGSGARQPAGALLGVVASVGVGVLLYQGGRRLNLRLFFTWTGAFVIVVAAGLAAGAVRAAHEAG